MDNRLNLEEYLRSFKSDDEKRKVFFAISEEMHRYHNNGCYIGNLSFQTVSVCFTNSTDIKFLYYDKIGKLSLEDVLNHKKNNILNLAIMMLSALLYNSNHLVVLNVDVIKKDFDKFKSILSEVDYNYFESVFIKDEYLYYDDYIRSITQTNPKPFVEKMKVSENEEAFTTYLLLMINLTVVLMIFSCILLYLG